MAKIETTFIRPKELFTPDTGETKVVYDGYQNNPHELVVQENLEGDVSEIVNDTFVPNDGGNVVFTDGSDVEHELITKSGLGKAQVIETTWQALKDLRDNSQLIAGSLYRITDYNCTTTQENTQSAGHQFDIVLLALSANKLAEEGWAMEHPTDVYDVTFNDDVTLKCYIYKLNETMCNVVSIDTLKGVTGSYGEGEDVEINGSIAVANGLASTDLIDSKLQYNYFQNSNLSAWKVWYCLDNDTARFAWADDSVDEGTPSQISVRYGGGGGAPIQYATCIRNSQYDTVVSGINYYCFKADGYPNKAYTRTETPSVDDPVFTMSGGGAPPNTFGSVESYTPSQQGTGLENGRGVIYRLIDEFNNDIKYDFKNIQFKRKITKGQYNANGTETWCYTLNLWYEDMCQDASIVGNTLPNDEGTINGVHGNVFGYVTAYDRALQGVNTFAFALGNNVVLSIDEGGEYYGIYSNTTGDSFSSNTIGNSFYCNMIANKFHLNKIGNNFNSNIIGNMFVNKTISDDTMGKNYGNGGVELATKDDLN